MECQFCKKEIDDDEYVVNWGICDECSIVEYEWYMESEAGPHDWLIIGDNSN